MTTSVYSTVELGLDAPLVPLPHVVAERAPDALRRILPGTEPTLVLGLMAAPEHDYGTACKRQQCEGQHAACYQVIHLRALALYGSLALTRRGM